MISQTYTMMLAASVLVITMTALSALPDPSAFANRPLNDNWRFLRGNAEGAEQPSFDDSAWRVVNLPHDWSIEDLPTRETDPLFAIITLVPGNWLFSPGDDSSWSAPDHQDTNWKSVSLPEPWSNEGQTAPDAFGWYRRHFTVPAGAVGKSVFVDLGVIKNQDWTYIDGQKVHESGNDYWSNSGIKSRAIELPPDVAKPGDHLIAVRIKGGDGNSGFVRAIPPPATPSPCDPGRSSGNISTGYAAGGTGWYRKHFTLARDDAQKNVRVVFDGSYMETAVWLNGVKLGRNVYGYSPFGFDLTGHLKPAGQENILAVRVDNLGANSRWYSGSGIYRPVHLEFGGASQIALWGLAVTTPEVTADKATVSIGVEMDPSESNPETTVHLRVLNSSDQEVGEISSEPKIAIAGGSAHFVIAISHPLLWSPENPSLYQVEATLLVDGKVTDMKTSSFGIRTLAWDADHGFLINGASIKLKGGCIHHDFGPLGSASFPQAEERRVATLRSAGYNAIRCSHNMPSSAFLDACDRQGMLVLDEAFDMWNVPKNPMDYSRFFKDWSQRDIEAMVRRDRNHPSIIMWSIGNEIPERFDPQGIDTAKRLAGLFRSLDSTRPVTAAFNNVADSADNFLSALDISGYNYCPDSFQHDHQRVKNRVMFTTESYPKDSFKYWQRVLQNPYVIGDFVWTAWDYRGESGIGHTVPEGGKSSYLLPWPYANAFCGDFDVCGFVKSQGLYRQVLWDARKMAIVADDLPPGQRSAPDLWGWRDELPSWTWPGTEGIPRTVRVYAKGDEVTLLLNGAKIGTEKIDPQFTATFIVPYAPGKLVAQVFKGGNIAEQDSLETTGAPVALRLSVAHRTGPADIESVSFVTVEALDDHDRVVPLADQKVDVSLTGPATLAAFGNGDPTNVNSVRSPEQALWQGRALLVVRSTGKAGSVSITARGTGLKSTQLPLEFR